MVFVMFMLGVGLRRQKLKPRPKSDLTLGIGLEVWQISCQVILLNLLCYHLTVISPITHLALAVFGLVGFASNPSRLKRCYLNLESRSSAFSFSNNFCLLEFLNSCWQIWSFRLCWIHLYFLFLGSYLPFLFSLRSLSLRFWCSGSWWSALLVVWISGYF